MSFYLTEKKGDGVRLEGGTMPSPGLYLVIEAADAKAFLSWDDLRRLRNHLNALMPPLDNTPSRQETV